MSPKAVNVQSASEWTGFAPCIPLPNCRVFAVGTSPTSFGPVTPMYFLSLEGARAFHSPTPVPLLLSDSGGRRVSKWVSGPASVSAVSLPGMQIPRPYPGLLNQKLWRGIWVLTAPRPHR